MDAKQLLELVQRYQENREFISNEETAKIALVIPFIRALGYDPSLPREVRLEFAAEFTQGDGKKLADRMDFAIFDKSGAKPLMVIETKPLGTDLRAKCQQLARYIAQLPDLHFGIITDGCHYLFFGDLENPNLMDKEPFFTFTLDDPKTDWAKVATFLTKFSREAFNAETLVLDAENARYRLAMIDRLSAALKAPAESEGFLRWLTEEVYKGNRTKAVMQRLGSVAREAIEPALLRVMGDDFLDKLKERIQKLNEGEVDQAQAGTGNEILSGTTPGAVPPPGDALKASVETTAEELEFFQTVRDVCSKASLPVDELVYRDNVNYFNVSFRRPKRWFVRFFANGKRRSVATLVPVEEAKALCQGFEVEAAPAVFGVSRVYIETVSQLWAIKGVVARSLELVLSGKAPAEKDAADGAGLPTLP